MTTEWGFWQIPHVGVPEPDLDNYTRTDTSTTIRRPIDMKFSNFGALNVGNRMSDDYTRTQITFSTKDNLSNWKVITADDGTGRGVGLRSIPVDQNPYVWGSSVKRFRDDQFFRMTMEHPATSSGLLNDASFASLYPAGEAAYIDKPKADVMDTKEVHSGMNQYKNYPTEGWRSFGGKNDFLPYVGTLGRPRGNKRE